MTNQECDYNAFLSNLFVKWTLREVENKRNFQTFSSKSVHTHLQKMVVLCLQEVPMLI